ncbi:MAG: M23 family metallopeptidase [Lachnospiraceae bacterium]
MRKQTIYLLLYLFLLSFFIEIGIEHLYEISELHRLNTTTITSDAYRSQLLNEELLLYVKQIKDPSEYLGLYWLESAFGKETFFQPYTKETFQHLKVKWAGQNSWNSYLDHIKSIWVDVEYFPIAEAENRADATVSYVDSWMFQRDYGGVRRHEGTDIMAAIEKRGFYPIVSMTDGVIANLGWLELGGYRIGILAPSGAYFYYAHMDSYANIQEGDTVKAGDLLGFMGDTGYGVKEGTKGKFPIHLHLGIYTYPNGKECSVNPYWILRYLEDKRIPYQYS